MAIYDFPGYHMDDSELEVVQAAADAMCAAGLDPVAANDVRSNGVMMSDNVTNEVCAWRDTKGKSSIGFSGTLAIFPTMSSVSPRP